MTRSPGTFTDILLAMGSRGGRPCFSYVPEGQVGPAETLSYAEVLDRSLRFGAGLQAYGVQRGDRVAMIAEPGPDYFTVFLGAILIGAVPAPINHNFRHAETADYLAYIDPRLVICDAVTQSLVNAVAGSASVGWRALTIGGVAAEREPPPAAAGAPARLTWKDREPADTYPAQPEDLVMILHTSGTTALPKGVERTHKAVRSFIDRWVGYAFREHDVILSWNPFYHQSGTLTSSLPMLAAGGHIVQWQRFSASQFWDVVERNRPTVATFAAPTATYLVLQPPRSGDSDNTIEFGIGGGRPDHWSTFQERFRINAHTPYGSTETSYATMTGGRDDPPIPASELALAGSHFYTGPAIPDFAEVRIMGPAGPTCPGVPGEIQVRGPAVFERYFRLPEVTARSFDGDWFRTGDLGYLRDDGHLFLIDRMKQVIRRSSENISPQEIEMALAQCPGVRECAVIGVPDPIRHQEILACVILEEGAALDPLQLLAFCAERLSEFKVPRYVEVWPDFPRTGTMKVRKDELLLGARGVTRFDRLAAVQSS